MLAFSGVLFVIRAICMDVASPIVLIMSRISSLAWLYINFYVRSPYLKASIVIVVDNLDELSNKRTTMVGTWWRNNPFPHALK